MSLLEKLMCWFARFPPLATSVGRLAGVPWVKCLLFPDLSSQSLTTPEAMVTVDVSLASNHNDKEAMLVGVKPWDTVILPLVTPDPNAFAPPCEIKMSRLAGVPGSAATVIVIVKVPVESPVWVYDLVVSTPKADGIRTSTVKLRLEPEITRDCPAPAVANVLV